MTNKSSIKNFLIYIISFYILIYFISFIGEYFYSSGFNINKEIEITNTTSKVIVLNYDVNKTENLLPNRSFMIKNDFGINNNLIILKDDLEIFNYVNDINNSLDTYEKSYKGGYSNEIFNLNMTFNFKEYISFLPLYSKINERNENMILVIK